MTRTDKTVTIASGQSLSASVQMGTGVPLAVIMPAAFTGTSLTFQGSHDGTNFYNIYDSSGNEVTATVSTSKFISLPASDLAAQQYIKVRSGTSGTPTTEGSARTITLITRQEKSR